jgi:predicted nucleic acid-binding protein
MPEPRDTKRTAHQRQRRAVRILRYQPLKRVAENRHILTSPDYLKERNSRQEALLVTEYLRTIGQNEVKVSENEVRAEYDKFVKARASAPDAATLKSQLKDLPYGVARNYIMRGLMAKRQEELATKWKEDRKRELSFRIVEKELEGK